MGITTNGNGSIENPYNSLAQALEEIPRDKNITLYGLNTLDKEPEFRVGKFDELGSQKIRIRPYFENGPFRLSIHNWINFTSYSSMEFENCELYMGFSLTGFIDNLLMNSDVNCKLSMINTSIIVEKYISNHFAIFFYCSISFVNVNMTGVNQALFRLGNYAV